MGSFSEERHMTASVQQRFSEAVQRHVRNEFHERNSVEIVRHDGKMYGLVRRGKSKASSYFLVGDVVVRGKDAAIAALELAENVREELEQKLYVRNWEMRIAEIEKRVSDALAGLKGAWHLKKISHA
jgi:hypothetical protein